jgi:hypothetical protein
MTYPDSNLPEIGILHRWHQQPLWNLIHVARILLRRWSIPSRNVLSNSFQVLITDFSLSAIQTRMVGCATIEVIEVLLLMTRFKEVV